MKRHLLPPVLLILIALAGACASPGTPSGGPRDETPPRFVAANPAPGSVNVDRKRIDIYFDEIVNVKDAFNKVVISPSEAETPRVSSLGKRVSVEFQDTLRHNTTYTIDFANSIEDNNEGNKLQGFTYTFSTGPEIDSLRISGVVLNALTLEPQQGVLVGAHSEVDDTTFSRKRLERITKTDDRGRFTLRGLKAQPYYIFSLADLNNDRRWDNPEEDIAFIDTPITPYCEEGETIDSIWNLKAGVVDSVVNRKLTRFLPNDVLLNSFNINKKSQYLVSNERIDSTRISLVFNERSTSLPAISLNGRPDNSWYMLERNASNDSLVYWIRDPHLVHTDTLRIAAEYLRTDSAGNLSLYNDSLRLVTNRPRITKKKKDVNKVNTENDSIQTPEVKFLGMKMLTSGSHEYYNPLLLEFDTPLDTLDKKAFHLEVKKDTIWMPVNADLAIEPADSLTLRRFKIDHKWEFDTEYRLRADSIAAIGIYGLFTRPLEHSFKVKKEQDYSNLHLTLSGLNDTIPAFVELLNSSDTPVRRVPVANSKASFMYLAPGTYYARVVEDINGNGIHDTGDYDLRRQPELAYYYPKAFKLKANWDVEQAWNVAETAIDAQKPDAIKKNKPERTKLDNLRKKQENIEEDDTFDPMANPFDPNSRSRRSY